MRTSTLFVLALTLCSCTAALAPRTTSAPAPSRDEGDAAIVRVVDGDTIVVALGGPRGVKVRLIGIDTPERDRCMYRSATARMSALVSGKRVRLVRDVSNTDRYGRLLRYVYVGDGFVNAAMVAEGFAVALTIPPDVAHAREFVALERRARNARRGLWAGGCAA